MAEPSSMVRLLAAVLTTAALCTAPAHAATGVRRAHVTYAQCAHVGKVPSPRRHRCVEPTPLPSTDALVLDAGGIKH